MKCEIKYAPTNLNEVIYPNVAVERRIKGYGKGELEGHVMLHGPNGTGKTTVAKLLVQEIGGDSAMLESLGFDELLAKQDLRGHLLQAAALARLSSSGKYFLLLNEFDNAKKGVNKLWTALDDCADGVMAIITTNEPLGVHISVRSRCDVIDMPGLSAVAVLPRVQFALQSEGLHLPNQQVLHYLKVQERLMDLRKYFKVADELLYLQRNGLPYPPWNGAAPTLKSV
jgi:DNA polymerase III delta prime subunit